MCDEISDMLKEIECQIADIQRLEANRQKLVVPSPTTFAKAIILSAFYMAIVRTCVRLAHGIRPTKFTSDDYLLLLMFTAVGQKLDSQNNKK